jgi:hypothetical protein
MSNEINRIVESLDISKFDNTASFLEEVRRLQNKNNKTNECYTISDQKTLSIVVRKLLKIEDEIKELNSKLTPLRKLKTDLRQEITRFMSIHKTEELNLPDGGYLVFKKTKKRLNPLTKKRLPGFIKGFFIEKKYSTSQADQLTNEIMEYIHLHTQHEDKETLNRLK